MKLQLIEQLEKLSDLQELYGDKSLDPILGAGCTKNTNTCFIFMNPTSKNVSSHKSWKGLKAPWIGTKNIWKMFHNLELLDNDIFDKLKNITAKDWDYELAYKLYEYLSDRKIYITNLAKCTQIDARHISDNIFKEYKELTLQEILTVNPKTIITFGNQVSSIFLSKNISVSKYQNVDFENLDISGIIYKVYPIYYPIGQGMRNIHKAKSRIDKILSNNK